MNILSFDIEEWALVKPESQRAAERCAEYDMYLNRILDTLDNRGIKATFFCTGKMAEMFPQVVKLIQSKGHEIGCHSYRHTWMNKMSEDEAREDTHAAVTALEQCIGQKVFSYRAPAFSIGKNNKWMFEILRENGIEKDASVFPAERDFGGFLGFGSKTPCVIECNGIRIKEYPISTTIFLGKELAYSGGGYFRFFPLGFVKGRMRKAEYTMCYFHIGDLVKELSKVPSKEEYESYFKEPGTMKARYMRYFKSNFGKKGAWEKMERLIKSEQFYNMQNSDELINWEKAPVVKLD